MKMARRQPSPSRQLPQPRFHPGRELVPHSLARLRNHDSLGVVLNGRLRRLRLAALAGSESGVLGLRRGIVEADVGAARESGGTGGAAVDFCGEDCVDEVGDCWIAGGYSLPALGGGEGFAVAGEAGDFLGSSCWA